MEKDIIMISNMFANTGWNVNNIGHEIINFFLTENKEHYIFIPDDGRISLEKYNRIKAIILVDNIENGLYPIIGVIHNPETIDDESILKATNGKIKYGNKDIKDIVFASGEGYSKNFNYVTFKNNPNNFKQSEEKIYIVPPLDKRNKTTEEMYIKRFADFKNVIRLKNKSNKAEKLKAYYTKEKTPDDYIVLDELVNKSKRWETYPLINVKMSEFYKKQNITHKTFFDILSKQDNEDAYTSMFCEYFKEKPRLFSKFCISVLGGIEDNFYFIDQQVPTFKHRENCKVNEKGYIDLLAIGEKSVIIIENKIESGMNGVYTDEDGNLKCQFTKYYNYIIDKCDKTKHLQPPEEVYLFAPDYAFVNTSRYEDKRFKIKNIPYSKIYNFFKENKREFIKNSIYSKQYFDDCLIALENHSYGKRKEIEKRFIKAIKN